MRTMLFALIAIAIPLTTHAQGREESLAVQCIHFQDVSRIIDIDGDFQVLNEIESFFFISVDRDPSPNRFPLRYGVPLSVFDAAKAKSHDYRVELTARRVDSGLSVTIAPTTTSRFQWQGERVFTLKDGDSVILKSQEDSKTGKSDALWIIFRRRDAQSAP